MNFRFYGRSHRTAVWAGALAGAVLSAGAAMAASEEAWDDFRADVRKACLTKGEELVETPAIVVDPFGSESYGYALMTGMEKGSANVRSVVCVFDKQSRTAEVSAPLDLATSEAPGLVEETGKSARIDRGTGAGVVAPFGGQCTEECEATLSLLDVDDQRKVTRLPQVIAQTILENPQGTGIAAVDGVRDVALSFSELVAGTPSDTLAAPRSAMPGKVPCSVYYYGFLNEPAKLVGNHTCTVSALEGGGLLLEKTTGERLRAELRPLTDGFSAVIGRNFLADQEERQYDSANPANAGNDNFGNVVGLATAGNGRLYVFSSEQRGFEQEDPTFFWALTVGG